MAAAGRDHYQVLGVDREAEAAEIKAAYRRLALRYHPDRNPGDKVAEERFKDLSVAYAVLGDPDKRVRYDRFGEADLASPFGPGADLDNARAFFESMFGDLFGFGRKRAAGHDLRYTLELDFREAALGCEHPIRFERAEDCRSCGGTGAEGGVAGLVTCASCAGAGSRRAGSGPFFTLFPATRQCLACGGAGELPRVKCAACGGAGLVDRTREFVVHVPAGSQGGGAQRVPGEGSPGRRGGPAGDLHVIMRVRPHPFYRQEGDLLVCEVPITMGEAALGAEIEIPLLDATVRMKIPAATQSGAVFRVRGKGLPRAAGAERGDAHVKVLVETPANLSDEAKALIDELSGALGDGAYPRRQAFRAALKKGATA